MKNIQWLIENGGPAIRLRLSVLPDSGISENDADCAVSDLLGIDAVRIVLNYFDGFQTQDRDKKTLEHLIHCYKENCLETFFPQIMDFGFRAGIPAFDEKMPPVADVFKYLFKMANDPTSEPISGSERQTCFNFSTWLSA